MGRSAWRLRRHGGIRCREVRSRSRRPREARPPPPPPSPRSAVPALRSWRDPRRLTLRLRPLTRPPGWRARLATDTTARHTRARIRNGATAWISYASTARRRKGFFFFCFFISSFRLCQENIFSFPLFLRQRPQVVKQSDSDQFRHSKSELKFKSPECRTTGKSLFRKRWHARSSV